MGDRCPSHGAARRGGAAGGGGRWTPSPAGSRARRGGWGSSRLCCATHVCPSSPGHGAQLSGAFTGSPNCTAFVAKAGAGRLRVAHIESYRSKSEVAAQINTLTKISVILTATVASVSLSACGFSNREPHGPERWVEPPYSNIPARHAHQESFLAFPRTHS